MSLARYSEYKMSGVAWLGEVPTHWDVMPFKWAIDRNDGGVWGVDPDGEDDTIVLRSTEQTVDGNWRIEDPAPRKLTEAEKLFALLLEGDLLVTKSSGSSFHIGKTTLVTAEIAALECCYSNFMQRIRTKHSFIPKFAWYVMNNDIARLQFDYLSNSTTGLANLNGTMIGQLLLTVPPLTEQEAITAFLDIETGKIDKLIAEQQRLVDLLAEKRQATISHAVTKGLNPDVPMKDSGTDWLGVVPRHWEVTQSRRMFAVRSQPALVTDRMLTASQKYGVLFQSDYVELEGRRVVEVIMGIESLKHVEPDDFIISMRSFQGGIEWCKLQGSTSFHYVMIKPIKGVYPPFFAYLFKSVTYIQALRTTTDLIRDGQELRYSNFAQVDLPVVPLEEQKLIATFLDCETAKFDTLTAEANRAIALLQERRSALISAAVTGKIDVRTLAPSSQAGEGQALEAA
jgi:type I restriction enzyme S subunit